MRKNRMNDRIEYIRAITDPVLVTCLVDDLNAVLANNIAIS